MNPNWREHGRVADNYITAICCSIKPELLYKVTLQANLPDMEDYFVALQLVLKTQDLVSSFGSEFDFKTSAMLVKSKHLPHTVLGANAKQPLLYDYYSQKTKNPGRESKCPADDSHLNYSAMRLPLSGDELSIYNAIYDAFESLNMGYGEASKFLFRVRLFEHANVAICRMASKLAQIDKEAVRIAKQECAVHNKQLYTINSSFAHHADGGISVPIMKITFFPYQP